LEFNWKGKLNPLLLFCMGVRVTGMLSVIFVLSLGGGQSRNECLALKPKIHNLLQRLQINLRSEMTIKKCQNITISAII